MGRLFWKFFVCILLAQLTAIVGIGGAVWLRNHNQEANQPKDLDTSPPAEMAINSAAATLEYGGVKALRRMLENMERHRVFAVDEQGHELLGRTVSAAMLRESHALLKQEGKRRVVRQVSDPEGKRFILFLPSRGMDLDRPLMAGLGGAQMALQGGPPMPRGQGPGFGLGPGPAPGPNPGPGTGTSPSPGAQPGQAYGQSPGPDPRFDPSRAGAPPDAPPNGRGYGGPGDMRGPRFQPLTLWVPIAAATVASLLFAMLLAWYFSRPIRALRQAFDAAAGGDLSPRFGAGGKGKRNSELNDLGRDFDRMTARLRSLIDGQTRLLHDVSHELRSPLARLQAAIGLAHQQPEKLAASLERIERESVRMDKLVGELLTLARLEAGAIKASQEEISMAELLEQIADDANYEASSQRRSVVQEGEADVMVAGQADLLGRAIENVVRNAIKHSPEGGVVQLQTRTLPDARQLCIRVLDRGPGVAMADLETIFQPFFRSSSASTEGHGLGLAIAQHVIEAHGGSIKASNRADGGLCVEMLLPVKG
ncbi:HAMP domain-containing protein [Rugamonas sp. FT82W]|uniref:histidine kinase n=1 Tax=Duganella vulcania TaxID=2692166 RepID=A0A845G0Y8_9BURK|nr:HAMP domain-containing protein [Duganella vulcania]